MTTAPLLLALSTPTLLWATAIPLATCYLSCLARKISSIAIRHAVRIAIAIVLHSTTPATLRIALILVTQLNRSPFTIPKMMSDVGALNCAVAIRILRPSSTLADQPPELDLAIRYLWSARVLCRRDPNRFYILNHLARLLARRFLDEGTTEDADDAVQAFEESLILQSADGPERLPTAVQLASILRARFDAMGHVEDLHVAIRHLDDILVTSECPSSCKAEVLEILGTLLLARFRTANSPNDLNRAIHVLQEACSLTDNSLSSSTGVAIPKLGVALLIRCKEHTRKDLQGMVDARRNDVFLPGYENRYSKAANTIFKTEYEEADSESDLKSAIRYLQLGLGLWGLDPTARCETLECLGDALVERFKRTSQVVDVEDAIGHFQELLETLPSDDPSRPRALVGLAVALRSHFRVAKDVTDLDYALQHLKTALLPQYTEHLDRKLALGTLGSTLLALFTKTSDATYLDQAVSALQEALSLHSTDDPDRLAPLSDLTVALISRFHRAPNLPDADAAIAYGQEALELMPIGHADRYLVLSSLSAALQGRYELCARPTYLNGAVSFLQEALITLPSDHPERPVVFNNLATAQLLRFKITGSMQTLKSAIRYFYEVLVLYPPGHSMRAASLSNVAVAHYTRFQRTGDKEDLNWAIRWHSEALSLREVDNPNRPNSLDLLGQVLAARFQLLGDPDDLDSSLKYHTEALSLRPPSHPDRFLTLNGLANALSANFERTGQLANLDRAVGYQREALELRPPEHTERTIALNNLALALSNRFQETKNGADLDEAIKLHEEALKIQSSSVDRPITQGNLCSALLLRFRQRKNIADLNVAIEYLEEVLAVHVTGHPDRPTSLCILAGALATRSEHGGAPTDLDRSIEYNEEALRLRVADQPTRPLNLCNLASVLLRRARHRPAQEEDIKNAVSHLQEAAGSCPFEHPLHALVHQRLGVAMLLQYQRTERDEQTASQRIYAHGSSAAQTIIGHLRSASTAPASPSDDRLRASCTWVEVATQFRDPTLMTAYETVIDILDVAVARSHSLESRHFALSTSDVFIQAKRLVIDAASVALNQDDPALAVTLLERGRTILFGQMLRYRPALEDLSAIDPALVERFSQLSRRLELSVISEEVPRVDSARPFEDGIARYQRLNVQWTQVVEQIRAIDGFASFLRPTPFQELQVAAKEGPVIVVNVSELRSDAIIVSSEGLNVVPLPLVEVMEIEALSTKLYGKEAKVDQRRQGKKRQREAPGVLRDLWDMIVCPVVEELEGSLHLAENSRIWWCASGLTSRLPLHAAGIYAKKDQNLLERYVSSYTPTLGALIRARNAHEACADGGKILVVAQPSTAGQAVLPKVVAEMECIQAMFPETAVLEGQSGTREAVLESISAHPRVHFACHGHLNNDNPLRSHFPLANGPLYLLELVEQRVGRGEFAFLSACHSAASDWRTPDESLNLAAGMQFAGFGSVVGTLWPMVDKDGPSLARDFYGYMKADNGSFKGCRETAMALREGVKNLRSRKVPTSRWIGFIHFGM